MGAERSPFPLQKQSWFQLPGGLRNVGTLVQCQILSCSTWEPQRSHCPVKATFDPKTCNSDWC